MLPRPAFNDVGPHNIAPTSMASATSPATPMYIPNERRRGGSRSAPTPVGYGACRTSLDGTQPGSAGSMPAERETSAAAGSCTGPGERGGGGGGSAAGDWRGDCCSGGANGGPVPGPPDEPGRTGRVGGAADT